MAEGTRPKTRNESLEMVRAMGMALGTHSPEKWGGKPPIPTCPECGEPVLLTTLFALKEFVCICCGWLGGYVEPEPKRDTEPLAFRLSELQRRWDEADPKTVGEACAFIERRVPGFVAKWASSD